MSTFLALVIAWITFPSLAIGWLSIIAMHVSKKDISGVVLCIAVPPFAIIFALIEMRRSLVPLGLFAIGLSGIVLLQTMHSTSGGHGTRTRNPLRGTSFPMMPLAIRLPSGGEAKAYSITPRFERRAGPQSAGQWLRAAGRL